MQQPAERPAVLAVETVTAQTSITGSSDSSGHLLSPSVSINEDKAADRDGDTAQDTSHVKWWQIHRWQRGSLLRLALLVSLVVAVIVLFSALPVWEWLDDFSKWSEKDENTALGMICMMGLYAVLTVLCFPGALLTILAGLLFGVIRGAIAVLVGATLGATLAFLVGRYIFKDWVDQSFTHRYPALKAVNAVISRSGFRFTFLIRLSPVIPFNALNYCLSLTSVGFWQYVVATFFGMIPGVTLYVYLGSTARSVKDILDGNVKSDDRTTVFFYVGLGVTVLLAILITRLARQQIRKELKKTEDEAEGGSSDDTEDGGNRAASAGGSGAAMREEPRADVP